MLGERKLVWPKTLSQDFVFVSGEGTAALSVGQQRRWEEKVSRERKGTWKWAEIVIT